LKILFVGDSPTVSTGFARCTRAACGELHRAGHEVSVLGINASGDPHGYPYDIYVTKPRGKGDAFGAQRLPLLAEQLKPDVIVLLQDPWNVDEYLDSLSKHPSVASIPVMAWLAVDAKNHPNSAELNGLSHVFTWTQFAIDELRAGGYTGPASIVPLGVDTGVFYPRDRDASRRAVLPDGISPDAFVVGVVGRNQPRKRVDLALAYFAEFVERYGIADAYLFLHVAPTGERACDIRSVAAHYGRALDGRIILSVPDIGSDLDDHAMPLMYSAFDVCLTCTQGEGWGLTTHEALACGVPCIVPDWSALGEWPGDAVVKVPCTSTALSAPLNLFPYTIGGVPDREETVKSLWKLYSYRSLREEYGARGLALAARPELQWSAVGATFRRELEAAVARAADSAVQAALDALLGEGGSPPPLEPEAVLAALASREPGLYDPAEGAPV
jgi:D-inositol-3-phosphate glycosyltransferase